jgi:hypothetical protein
MIMGKIVLVAAAAMLAAVPALAGSEPDPPCGSWKDRPPPAPSDQAEDDAGLSPPPKEPPAELRPLPDGAARQDPGKRIK